MERNTIYLQRFEKEIKNIAKSKGLTDSEVRDLVDKFFKSFKKKITDPRMPTIKITNLGTFKPTISRLDYQIKRYIAMIRSGKVSNSEQLYKDKINYLWKIKQRLIKEGDGQETWKEWRNKKLEINAKK